jgi:hypothetical protein
MTLRSRLFLSDEQFVAKWEPTMGPEAARLFMRFWQLRFRSWLCTGALVAIAITGYNLHGTAHSVVVGIWFAWLAPLAISVVLMYRNMHKRRQVAREWRRDHGMVDKPKHGW